jgi:hypothetical protein
MVSFASRRYGRRGVRRQPAEPACPGGLPVAVHRPSRYRPTRMSTLPSRGASNLVAARGAGEDPSPRAPGAARIRAMRLWLQLESSSSWSRSDPWAFAQRPRDVHLADPSSSRDLCLGQLAEEAQGEGALPPTAGGSWPAQLGNHPGHRANTRRTPDAGPCRRAGAAPSNRGATGKRGLGVPGRSLACVCRPWLEGRQRQARPTRVLSAYRTWPECCPVVTAR